jgi:hypothetical protein
MVEGFHDPSNRIGGRGVQAGGLPLGGCLIPLRGLQAEDFRQEANREASMMLDVISAVSDRTPCREVRLEDYREASLKAAMISSTGLEAL